MPATDTIPTLDQLAETINAEHRACENAARAALDHAIRCGGRLVEAKAKLRHGEWLPWLGANCELADRTSQAYMRLYENRSRFVDPNTQRVASLPVREALRLLATTTASPPRLRTPPPENPADVAEWHCGDWRDHVATLPDASVRLVLTDPPYGMAYRSGHRQDRHDRIADDNSPGAAAEALREFLDAVRPKLIPDAHVHVFCRWGESERRFIEALVGAGCDVRGSLVWAKNNTSMGDLWHAYAPKHECILHGTRGKPELLRRTADVLAFARVGTDRHPTEKPVALLRELIETTTSPGELVVDPFAGVGSTCVAAMQAGRSYWGCEVEARYYAFGAERLAECSTLRVGVADAAEADGVAA